jgi:tRNA(adenine34) deaminase
MLEAEARAATGFDHPDAPLPCPGVQAPRASMSRPVERPAAQAPGGARSDFSPGDVDCMRRALALAAHARDAEGEVPVGAVLVLDGKVAGEGWNRNITLSDPSAHAEIGALRDAGRRLGNHRIPGATLYVTLEPCAMCAMALVHARVARVVYGTTDPKTGAAGSVFDTLVSERHNHRIAVRGGLLADESAAMLRAFFEAKR